MNVQWRVHTLRKFITHPHVHMYQKKKIALEIAAKIASVNGPLSRGVALGGGAILEYTELGGSATQGQDPSGATKGYFMHFRHVL